MPEGKRFPDKLGGFGDDFYEQLMQLHQGLSDTESQALNARLVLLMANEIGDPDRLKALLQAAGQTGKSQSARAEA